MFLRAASSETVFVAGATGAASTGAASTGAEADADDLRGIVVVYII
jgi:hypothetical protein